MCQRLDADLKATRDMWPHLDEDELAQRAANHRRWHRPTFSAPTHAPFPPSQPEA